MGQFGVTISLLCSGFMISMTFAGLFAVGRRHYSVVIGTALYQHHRFIISTPSVGQIIVSPLLTMLVLVAVPRAAYGIVTAGCWVVATVLLTTVSYRCIERPMIAFGRQLSARMVARGQGRVVERVSES